MNAAIHKIILMWILFETHTGKNYQLNAINIIIIDIQLPFNAHFRRQSNIVIVKYQQ